MFQFTVQSADHSNIDAVCKISQRVLNSELPSDKLTKQYLAIIEDIEQIVMIAENSGHTVGFVHARRVSDLVYGNYAEIVAIALLPYYQRRGGGTSLMLGIEQWSKQMLTSELKCFPKSDNIAVRQLLIGCGYAESKPGIFAKTIV